MEDTDTDTDYDMHDSSDDADSTTDGRPPRSPEEVTPDNPYTIQGFFDALDDGWLLAARCSACEKRLIPPRPACYACGSRDLRLERQPDTGSVVSYTEVARPPAEFADLAPYTVAIVELETGARLTGRLETPYEDVEIGMPVRVAIRGADQLPGSDLAHEEGWPLHVFESV